MRKITRILIAFFALFFLSCPALADTRALLVACSDFVTQPDLGSAISGNLHMIGSALLGTGESLSRLSIEDGTIGTVDQLRAAAADAFDGATEEDLSILYLCTHGVLSSSDDSQAYLLLGNGETESILGADALYDLLSGVQGEKVLILDACFSGALLGRGEPEQFMLPGVHKALAPLTSPFLSDSSIHVLTSASGSESSWYYDSEGLQRGAVSYFASALSSGLGLYGSAEADLNGDGMVSLQEMHRYLNVAVPSSTSQLLSVGADGILLPAAQGAMLSRPLSGFSYGSSLLTSDDATLEFSFTVTRDTAVQYRVVDYDSGSWNWAKAQTFMDEGNNENGQLSAGRHTRSLTLPTVKSGDSGYLMLQIFSVEGSEIILCSERLIAVQSTTDAADLALLAPDSFPLPGASELPIRVTLSMPAEVTVSVFDESGALIRRLAASQLTRPSPASTLDLYWDGRNSEGSLVPSGRYTLCAEAYVGFTRMKTVQTVTVGET